MADWRIEVGDCRDVLRAMLAGSVHTVVTSPPYFGLRDYGTAGQIGLEPTPDEFVAALVDVFREVRRVLRDDGTVWLNLGDSYAGSWGAQSRPDPGPQDTSTLGGGSMLSARQIEAHPKGTKTGSLKNTPGMKAKDLMGIPWMVAFALRADGWYLRSDIIWSKPNPMPESVTDRPTKSHEYVFLLSKGPRYFYDADAIREAAEYDGPNGAQQSPYAQGFGRRSPEQEVERREKRRTVRPGIDINGGGQGSGAMSYPAHSRNKRSVWTVATQPYAGAHFATFPPKLIEPCILAGAPERACGECGAPWVRVVDVESRPNWQGNGGQKHNGTYYRENIGGGVGNDRRARTDLGFEPSCSHGDGSARGVVLDPFAGAGTTGLVALQHGREFVGVELNPEYAAMARDRIETAVRLGFRAPQNGAKVADGQESLFG